MTTKEYLEEVISLQTLKEDSQELKDLRKHRDDVEKVLRDAFSDSSPTIRYGGSKAKGSLIRESYDLDVISYLAHLAIIRHFHTRGHRGFRLGIGVRLRQAGGIVRSAKRRPHRRSRRRAGPDQPVGQLTPSCAGTSNRPTDRTNYAQPSPHAIPTSTSSSKGITAHRTAGMGRA